MSKQALDSDKLRQRLKEILLGPAALMRRGGKRGRHPTDRSRQPHRHLSTARTGDLDHLRAFDGFGLPAENQFSFCVSRQVALKGRS
jgi:hypothetical protein